jgi:hypothetical protein
MALCLAASVQTMNLYGQYENGLQPGNISTVQIKGELQDSNGKVLQIKKEDGTSLYVMMPQEIRNIEFQADVTVKQLLPGMLARLRVDYEKLRSGTISVETIDLFPPAEVGIVKPRSPRDRANYVPGMYPVAQLGNDPNSKEIQIVGEVVGVKDGVLVLNAGEAVQVKLDDDTKMKFRTSSLEFAKQGNKVEGNGISNNPQSNQVAGNRITITGELPEQAVEDDKSAAKEKTKGKTKRKKGRESKAQKQASDESSTSERSTK